MLMNRDEGGELRPPRWEIEEDSFDEVSAVLAEGTITRAQAIKLGGGALLAGTGMLLVQSPADARRRHKRCRREKKVTATPNQVDFGQQPVGIPSTPQDRGSLEQRHEARLHPARPREQQLLVSLGL